MKQAKEHWAFEIYLLYFTFSSQLEAWIELHFETLGAI